ncbi:DUF502 domain-containing protein [Gammaproteobacteria bacterium AB-CW1]|uniref:DUF502 domain-containing protein n=1 Tax=Natronospira elongata TaxID=3110268 RepID=A0AAP6MK95_9GAMM|nr:DUF502 domain-containing protein [Gammaproteobacteria bacterium AB-CW1]
MTSGPDNQPGLITRLRRYFVAGILVLVPVGVTIFALRFLVNLLDRSLTLLPEAIQPEQLLGFAIPGLGIVLSLVVLILTGMLAANFFGRKLVEIGERILDRIPVVRSIYYGSKQIAETMFSGQSDAFRKPVLIPYPHERSWALAFVTNNDLGEIQYRTGIDVVGVYVPTTPNPTSGFNLMIPREDVIELDMTVDEALRMIISLGVVVPVWDPNGHTVAKAVEAEAKKLPGKD